MDDVILGDGKVSLMFGDCAVRMKDMDSESIDLVVTSPPYPGVNNMWGELFSPENFDAAHNYLNMVWSECVRVLRPGCKLIINIANTKRRPYLANVHRIYTWAETQEDVEPLGEIIWNKGYAAGGTAWGTFRSPADMSLADVHEYILVFRKKGDRNKSVKFEKIPKKNFQSWRNSIWNISPESAKKVGHCAPFPLAIPKRLIILYSFAGETVLDPFSGSCTTGIAAHQLSRSFVGIDNNEEYFKLGCNRMKDAMQQATLL